MQGRAVQSFSSSRAARRKMYLPFRAGNDFCNSRADADRRRAPRKGPPLPHARWRPSRARLSERRPRTHVPVTGGYGLFIPQKMAVFFSETNVHQCPPMSTHVLTAFPSGHHLFSLRGHCWTLLDIVGHCWTLLDIGGHWWTLLHIGGHCWTLVDRGKSRDFLREKNAKPLTG